METLGPKQRFTATAKDYDRYRPSYPPEMLDWLLARAELPPRAKAADVGCGTGISTRLLSERGLEVTGIDANADMLEKARRRGGPGYRLGSAEATGLPDSSVDLVTVAQAFHWFETEAALAEFGRILRPGGRCSAFWNDRTAETPFLRGYEDLLVRCSSEYRKLRTKERSIAEISASERVAGLERAEFPSVQEMDEEAFLGRVRSSSYVVHGIADRPAFEEALADLFRRHAAGGRVQFRYKTIVLLWRPA